MNRLKIGQGKIVLLYMVGTTTGINQEVLFVYRIYIRAIKGEQESFD